MKGIAREFTAAFRQLRRHPWFVAGAAVSLALGMALATAVFSVVEAVRFGALPWDESDRVVRVYEIHAGEDRDRVAGEFLLILQSQAASFSAVAGHNTTPVIVGRTGAAKRVNAARVTPDFFDVLGVRPAIGSVFDDSPSSGDAVIISHSLWKSSFGGRQDVIGARLSVGQNVFTIVGIMPASFDYPDRTALWLLLPRDEVVRSSAATSRSRTVTLQAIARLRPGVSPDRASAETALLFHRALAGNQLRMRSARVIALRDHIARSMRDQLRLWGAAAVLILMLCAVNFAAVSLARGMRRRNELAVRASLGASRQQVSLMLLTEALTLAGIAGLLTALFAAWIIQFADVWLSTAVTLKPRVGALTLLFGTIGTVVVGFMFAMAPAFQLANVDLRSVLQAGATAATARGTELRGRRGIVALQLALALASVATVVSLVRADTKYQSASVGFDHSQLIVGVVSLTDSSIGPLPTEPLLQHLRSHPAVTGAAALSGCTEATVSKEDGTAIGDDLISCRTSPGYFRAVGIGLLAGHYPSDAEIASGQHGVVLSYTAATRAFGSPTQSIGNKVVIRRTGWAVDGERVLGVVPDGGSALYGFAPSVYRVTRDHGLQGGLLIVRVSGQPQFRLRELERNLSAHDNRLTVSDLNTAVAVVDEARRATRGRNLFLGAVTALSLLLATIGVFSLTSYTTQLRARELGIRVALGASPAAIVRVVVADLASVAAIGMILGLVASQQIVSMLDAVLRSPWMKGSFVSLAAVPTLSCVVALLIVVALGTAVPLSRILGMDVVHTLQKRV